LTSGSRLFALAATGLAVLLAGILAPFPNGNETEADHPQLAANTAGGGAALHPSLRNDPERRRSAASAEIAHDDREMERYFNSNLPRPALAAERSAAIASVKEAPPERPPLATVEEPAEKGLAADAASGASSPLAAIGTLAGNGRVGAPVPARTKVALSTAYAEPEAQTLRMVPEVTPPTPANPAVTVPLVPPSRSDVDLSKVMPGDWNPAVAPLPAWIAPPDAFSAKLAIAAYRRGDLALGDAYASTAETETGRAALEWVAIRMDSHGAGFKRITAFLKVHPDWPSAPWLRRLSEEALYADKQGMGLISSYFSKANPATIPGRLALARLDRNEGRTEDAAALVRAVWREGEFGAAFEARVIAEFGGLLGTADHKFRADRAFYREDRGRLMRAAARAGGDEVALAKAEAAVLEGAHNAEALLGALPEKLKADPSYLFARIHLLRRMDKPEKLAEAARLMLSAPRDPALLVDGDAWWVERRLIARKLLDEGHPEMAYRICAEHSAVSAEMRIEAEFHAGWIALRFLDDPTRAAPHFATAAAIAAMPASVARAAYWQGRTAQALGDAAAAESAYAQAAVHSTTYYGQLARAKLHLNDLALRETRRLATGEERDLVIRVAEFLYAMGERDLALPLVSDAARGLTDIAQMAALGKVVENGHDARAALILGKIATQRGYPLDDFAFPTFGVPYYQPVAHSADRSIVYAIARQESAFAQTATSTAGAKGLMQLMPATARRTAEHEGIPLDMSKLNTDGSLNARIGAAHLGELLSEMRGSYALTFAAYNAGGKRVKEWIAEHGDPRHSDVDPVDWIERIPIAETRDYVQRIIENMQVYRARFGHAAPPIDEAELARRGGG